MKITKTIQGIDFEWDSQKALSNWHKHQVAFESACEVFFDPFLQPDKDEVIDGELRETVIGMTQNWRLLFIAYTLRNDKIRVISARPVTRQQRKTYEDQ